MIREYSVAVKDPMSSRRFQKKKEDFLCAHCGEEVIGNGYTNHCPSCLHSLHVDIFPGDRRAPCGGLMAPVRYHTKNGEERLIHRCVRCGHEHKNRVADGDSRDSLLSLMKGAAEDFSKGMRKL